MSTELEEAPNVGKNPLLNQHQSHFSAGGCAACRLTARLEESVSRAAMTAAECEKRSQFEEVVKEKHEEQ